MDEREYGKEYLSEEEAKALADLFSQFKTEYEKKDAAVSDQEWLTALFERELPQITGEEAKKKAEEVIGTIHTFEENLASVNDAAQNGVSKENWLADKAQTVVASAGTDLNAYGHALEAADELFYTRNAELLETLTTASAERTPASAVISSNTNPAETNSNRNAAQNDSFEGKTAGSTDSRRTYTVDQIRGLAKSIGKNAGIMAAFVNATTVGYDLAYKMIKKDSASTNERPTDSSGDASVNASASKSTSASANTSASESDKSLEAELELGAEASLKLVMAGTLVVAVQKGLISFIPLGTPAAVLVNIPCAAVENIKIIRKISSGEISMTKGLDQMGRAMVSMAGGMLASAGGSLVATSLVAWIPIIGAPLAALTGLIGGVAGFTAGSKIGTNIYECEKEIAGTLKETGKVLFRNVKRKLRPERFVENYVSVAVVGGA